MNTQLLPVNSIYVLIDVYKSGEATAQVYQGDSFFLSSSFFFFFAILQRNRYFKDVKIKLV